MPSQDWELSGRERDVCSFHKRYSLKFLFKLFEEMSASLGGWVRVERCRMQKDGPCKNGVSQEGIDWVCDEEEGDTGVLVKTCRKNMWV